MDVGPYRSHDMELTNETFCVILFTPPPSLHDDSRHFSFQSTGVYSALGAVFVVDELYKLTFYLLTYSYPSHGVPFCVLTRPDHNDVINEEL